MENFQHESIDEIADVTARRLTDYAAQSAFKLFRDKKFRDHAGFATMSRSEHDRIFNELLCAYVTLIMLLLEARDLRSGTEFRSYFDDLSKKIPEALVALLGENEVGAQHFADWRKLIDLRYEEYARDKHEVRKAAMELESSAKTLDVNSLAKIQLLVPVQSVAIGCHHHVCRGKTEGKDELFKVVLKDLSTFYVTLRVRFEGGRITLATKILAKMMSWFRA